MQTARQKRDESGHLQMTDYIKSPWTKLIDDRRGEDKSRLCKESSNQQEEISNSEQNGERI